ncbi:MAG: hypothetical protein U1F11_13945 [Steroidobacteraceae bacterium]
MLEFLLACVLVLLPLTLAVIELAQLTAARHALDYAAFAAARAGAVHSGDPSVMRQALARGLMPLFAPVSAQASGPDAAAATTALGRATIEVLRPDRTELVIENPDRRAADDFAIELGGRLAIPNDGLEFSNPWGERSAQSLRDANVLALRVRYCREFLTPWAASVVTPILRSAARDPFALLCLGQGRLPIESRAMVHMQSAFEARFAGPGP